MNKHMNGGQLLIAAAGGSRENVMTRSLTMSLKFVCMLSVVALLHAASSAAAVAPQQKCEAGKKLAAGKYAACRLKAESNFAKDGDLSKRAGALTKCADALLAKFQKLENTAAAAGAACPTSLDGEWIQYYLGVCTEEVASATETGGSLPHCGDGDMNAAGEQCDDTDLAGASCTGLGFAGGDLACDGTCHFNTANCTVPLSECGNAAIDGTEECDQANLDGATCVSEGFTGGHLKCGNGCQLDLSGCYVTRFTDNGDGTISDHHTGLQWEKKIKRDSVLDTSNPHDADNQYFWSKRCSSNLGKYCQPTGAAAAVCGAMVEGDATGCATCTGGEGVCIDSESSSDQTIWQWVIALNAANFGGHNDWRIPTRAELDTIADRFDPVSPTIDVAFHGTSCGASCTALGDPACSCTWDDMYATSTTVAWELRSAWVIDFDSTLAIDDGKYGRVLVRAVRGTYLCP